MTSSMLPPICLRGARGEMPEDCIRLIASVTLVDGVIVLSCAGHACAAGRRSNRSARRSSPACSLSARRRRRTCSDSFGPCRHKGPRSGGRWSNGGRSAGRRRWRCRWSRRRAALAPGEGLGDMKRLGVAHTNPFIHHLAAYARGGGAPLDRRGQVEADRTQIPLLHDLGDDPALCRCRA